MAKKKNQKMPKFSSEETYELLRIKTIQNVESDIKERLFSKLKLWGLVFTIAIGLAGFLGFTSFWNLISSTIDNSVDTEVEKRISPQLLKLENRIDDTWESSILAKSANQKIKETSENVELQIQKSNENIEQTMRLNGVVKDSIASLQYLITSQNKELDRLKTQMVSLFNSLKTESFKIENNSKTRVINLSEKETLVIIRLESIPIEGSVKLQWHIYSQPPDSFFINKNVIYFKWGDPASKLNTKQTYVSYAADPSDNNLLGELKEVNGEIFAGESKIFGIENN